MGKEFENSSRVNMLCQQVDKDELGFQTLGAQFHWEIRKDSLTPDTEAKLKGFVEDKAILERPFKLQQVTRTNPTSGEVITKIIAGI